MAALRRTPTPSNGGSDDGTDFANLLNEEITRLWEGHAFGYLTNIGGTANAITADSDTSKVATIGTYARPMAFWLPVANTNTGAVTINIDAQGAVAIRDWAGTALVGGELLPGVYPIVFDGSIFRAITVASGSGSVPTVGGDLLHVRDEKVAGTQGGTFTAGDWRTRTLNTVKTNGISGASLTSNQITLPAGTYDVDITAEAYLVQGHKLKLYNITDAVDQIIGQNAYSGQNPGNQNDSPVATSATVKGRFTLVAQKVFEVRHRCTNSGSTSGFGIALGFGVVEVYCDALIRKIG
jgi:hypothetical protein